MPFSSQKRWFYNEPSDEVLSEIYKTEKGIIKYKYADSETVYKKKIEYVFLNKGKPELMNLKHLVAINSKHYENTTKLSGKWNKRINLD